MEISDIVYMNEGDRTEYISVTMTFKNKTISVAQNARSILDMYKFGESNIELYIDSQRHLIPIQKYMDILQDLYPEDFI